ncbi:MAG TPA: cellulose synthase operon protein YhjQ/BcsQ [Pirellulales bacterium]|nr:cellulose synthase operon protein YhjQ/BcsQ [Pirellulales bacterium]
MSTLNGAFIRAYQRQSESPGPHASFIEAAPPARMERFTWPDTCECLLAAAAEPFAALAAELVNFTLLGPKSVWVTGCRRGEGRTTLALTLARQWSRLGRRVLLVDADFDRPRLAQSLGMTVAAGLAEVVSGKITFSEAVVEAADGTALLLLGGAPIVEQLDQAPDWLPADRQSFLRRFDCICFDAGPLACPPGPMTKVLLGAGAMLDAALVVRDVRHTVVAECERLAAQLARAGVGRWHLVENFT